MIAAVVSGLSAMIVIAGGLACAAGLYIDHRKNPR